MGENRFATNNEFNLLLLMIWFLDIVIVSLRTKYNFCKRVRAMAA